MNRYKKTIQNIRNRHNCIVAFSKKIQEAMGLMDEDAKWAFRNNVSWDFPDFYRIECSTSQGINVLTIETTSDQRWTITNPPPPDKQKEILKLIKNNR